MPIVLALHGGAGDPLVVDPVVEEERLSVLREAVEAGAKILRAGGPATEAVVAAVVVLEDSPLFNAGRGAVLARDGSVSFDASIMDGRDRSAGAVGALSAFQPRSAAVCTAYAECLAQDAIAEEQDPISPCNSESGILTPPVPTVPMDPAHDPALLKYHGRLARNPIRVADLVRRTTPHIALAGDAAHILAARHGMPFEVPDWFVMPERVQQLRVVQALARSRDGHDAVCALDHSAEGAARAGGIAKEVAPATCPGMPLAVNAEAAVRRVESSGVKSSAPGRALRRAFTAGGAQRSSLKNIDRPVRRMQSHMVTPISHDSDDDLPDFPATAQPPSEPRVRDASGHDVRGTVGCVALDMHGHVAAATSTGGLCNKMPGRIGDSACIGSGTWALDATCAVSATGHGELFIRQNVAARISHIMEFTEATLEEAAARVVYDELSVGGSSGGVVAVDGRGVLTMPYNTLGMYRAALHADGTVEAVGFDLDKVPPPRLSEDR
eukprot:TRINITY_DN2029_c0_g1_i1.p1 TRINITY_DN2029_c0_g1~~TRINITY_DN2029_c0_g1_i1.p1  ORF type:complete len:496 (-),score=115.20 TRINITY_DN2029_c0_g1_i1:484-1971(-)